MRLLRRLALLVLTLSLACAPPPPPPPQPEVNAVIAGGVGDEPEIDSGRPVAFADGGLVLVVNPVVDAHSTGALPVPPGRDKIGIKVGPYGTQTDTTGLAVLDNLPVGTAVVEFQTGYVNVSLDQVGLVDAVALYNPAIGPALVSELRYPRSSPDVRKFDRGIYPGPLEIDRFGAVLYGEVNTDNRLVSVLDGDLIIRADGVRVRNLIVTGQVIIFGDGVSVAFCEMGTVVIRGCDALLLRDLLHARPLVTGPDALLLDTLTP